jgi:hypothetical protein
MSRIYYVRRKVDDTAIKPVMGERVLVKEYPYFYLFVHKYKEGRKKGWQVSELATGASVSSSQDSPGMAVSKANENLKDRDSKDVLLLILNIIRKSGVVKISKRNYEDGDVLSYLMLLKLEAA